MTYLLDTNVISETIKKNPNECVIQWLSVIDADQYYLSVVSLGEIRKGVEKLTDPQKKQKIVQWLEIDLVQQFQGRMISIDPNIADKWGYLCSLFPIPAIDALIAASAIVHNLKLVTRHTKDFEKVLGLELINPWHHRIDH